MLLKQIMSAIMGGFALGFVISIISSFFMIPLWIIGVFIWGEAANEVLAWLAAVGGICSIICGMILGWNIPVRKEAERRQKEAEEAERQREEETARLQRQREAEAARLQRHKEEQERYYKQMVSLCEQSLAIFESMPGYLDIAEKYLNQAEANFAEGAFAPFWDSVENAAKWLAYFNKDVRQIEDKLSHYNELIGKYEGMPPRFSLAPQSVKKLGVSTATAERMEIIVRAAQRNFQFTMIYEQRKTNQILVAGFKTLAEALEQMTWNITASLDDLANSVNTSLRAINSRLDETTAMNRQHHSEMMEQVSEVAKREREVVKKLDDIQRNIQRRR